MDSNFVILCCFVAAFLLLILYIENKKEINSFLNKHSVGLFFSITIVSIFLIYGSINFYIKNRDYDFISNDSYDKLNKEFSFYRELKKEKYDNEKAIHPYIPAGFHYIEGEALSGFVIEDEQGNQYVWIPCSNKAGANIPELKKSDFADMELTLNMDCYDSEYEEFFKSAFKNGGFYVSRYEIGKENENVVSKKAAKVITDVSNNDADKIVSEIYSNREDIKCQLLTGYAYDTMLSWIENTNSVEGISMDCSKETEIVSGRNEYNKINDLYDTVLEITCESYLNFPVARGYSHLKKQRPVAENQSRYTLDSYDATELIPTDKIAIRTMIYKIGD